MIALGNVLVVGMEEHEGVLDSILSLKYTLLKARDVKEATSILIKRNIHVVVVSINVPMGDGFSLLKFVKEKKTRLPFIFVLEHTQKQYGYEALKLGCYDLIELPLVPLQVAASVQRAVQDYRTFFQQNKLQKMVGLLEASMHHIPNPILVGSFAEAQMVSRVDYVNGAFSKLYGYALQDIASLPLSVLFGSESSGEFIEELQRSVSLMGEYTGETQSYSSNGAAFYSEWEVHAIDLEEEKRIFWLAFITKNSDKKRQNGNQKPLQMKAHYRDLQKGRHLEAFQYPEIFDSIITVSPVMFQLFHSIEKIHSSFLPTLIVGEPGVGKKRVAESVHRLKCINQEVENERSFLSLNAASQDKNTVMEALSDIKKKVIANSEDPKEKKVTFFIENISELTIDQQTTLNHILNILTTQAAESQNKKEPVVYLIASASLELEKKVEQGAFRAELYYRLRTHYFVVPPLRERTEDLIPLVMYFLKEASAVFHKPIPSFPSELQSLLSMYSFPGNILELRTMIYQAMSHHRRGILSLSTFKEIVESNVQVSLMKQSPQDTNIHFPTKLPSLKDVHVELVKEALKRADNNQGIAASLLGISRQALNRRLQQIKEDSGLDLLQPD